MKTVVASIALFVVGAFAQSSLTINTPSNVVECEPTLLSWSGGTAPYIVSIYPGSTPNGASIETFPATNSTSLTWTCNIQSGTSIGLNLRDSTGSIAQSAAFNVGTGVSNSCLNTTSLVPGGTSTPAGSTGTTPATGPTTTGPSAGTTASGSTAASASPSSSTSGASANGIQFGVVGIVGAAIAALFL